jgi:hypothetical protein
MPEFANLDELQVFINGKVEEIMDNEMAQMVKQKESESVETNVYDKYRPNNGEPYVYKRRETSGGLADVSNMQHNVTNNRNGVTLSVENITKGQQENFKIADLVEYGDGYNGKEYQFKNNRDGTAKQYLVARPFTEKTEDIIEQTNEHVKIMEKGLKSKGIDIV